ncbi:MAG TPA: DUF72 domain-containing protein [Candidatus Kapabacteria bacterium]|nr:DUF72 domain-containing protein [Candidatus Kapabacteria bacterium]
MKFGHLDEVSRIDFSLPPDHSITAKVLKGKPAKQPKIFSGLAEWGNEGFPGKIYPKSAKAKDYLKLYGEQFKIVELNATGYRIPSVKTVEGWIGTVPNNFIFCPKVSQPISQVKPLGRDKNALLQFYDAMRAFGDHLGTVFLQLHPTFSPNRYDDLVNFLSEWDSTFPLFVELRHADWFSNPEVLNNLFEEMRKRKIGTVITDTPGRRDVLHMGLTTPSAFIRFEGNELHPTDFTRLHAWAEHIKHWIDRGLETVYFFPHTTTKSLTPEMSNHFLTLMNKLCGLDLKLANILEEPNLKL